MLLITVRVPGQEDQLVEDPALHELITRIADEPYLPGTPFARVSLECLFYRSAVVRYALTGAEGEPRILLTAVRTRHANYELYPNLVSLGEDGKWYRTAIPVTGDGWSFAHSSADGRNVVLLMDNVPESPGHETRVVISNDGGTTWSYGQSLRKYLYFDHYQYFAMDESGTGTAIEYNGGEVGGYEKVGYFVYHTGDWGRNWFEREYHVSYDTNGFADTVKWLLASKAGRRALADIELPGFDGCP